MNPDTKAGQRNPIQLLLPFPRQKRASKAESYPRPKTETQERATARYCENNEALQAECWENKYGKKNQ